MDEEQGRRDVEKHLVDYQSQYVKLEYCRNCGRPVKSSEWMCPNCGYWVDAHNGITNDAEEAKRIREQYDKRREK